MQTFIYKVKDETGREYTAIAEADNAKSLKKMLRGHGWYTFSIRVFGKRAGLSLFRRKASLNMLIMFTHQLGSLLGAGIPILNALEIIWKQSNNPKFQVMVSELKNKLSQGKSLSDSFNELPHIFPNIYRALMGVAEAGGNLVNILNGLLEYFNNQKIFLYKMKKAISYPLIVLSFSVFVVMLMLLWVVPTFQTVFAKMRAELPLLTVVILKVSAQLRSPYFWIGLFVISIAAYILYRKLSKTAKFRETIDAMKLKVPVFNHIAYTAAISRFLRSLQLLLYGGLPITKSIEVARDTILNSKINASLDVVQDKIMEGVSLGVSLRETKIFPPFLVEMLSIGEESGNLVDTLDTMAAHFEEEFDYNVNRFLVFLEPALIIAVGGMVIFILLSLYLPIFRLWGHITQMGG